MAAGFAHTVSKQDHWANELEGGDEFGVAHANKEEAIAAGRAHAEQDATEHVVHNQDGTISERDSFGNDPASRPG